MLPCMFKAGKRALHAILSYRIGAPPAYLNCKMRSHKGRLVRRCLRAIFFAARKHRSCGLWCHVFSVHVMKNIVRCTGMPYLQFHQQPPFWMWQPFTTRASDLKGAKFGQKWPLKANFLWNAAGWLDKQSYCEALGDIEWSGLRNRFTATSRHFLSTQIAQGTPQFCHSWWAEIAREKYCWPKSLLRGLPHTAANLAHCARDAWYFSCIHPNISIFTSKSVGKAQISNSMVGVFQSINLNCLYFENNPNTKKKDQRNFPLRLLSLNSR